MARKVDLALGVLPTAWHLGEYPWVFWPGGPWMDIDGPKGVPLRLECEVPKESWSLDLFGRKTVG